MLLLLELEVELLDELALAFQLVAHLLVLIHEHMRVQRQLLSVVHVVEWLHRLMRLGVDVWINVWLVLRLVLHLWTMRDLWMRMRLVGDLWMVVWLDL